MKLKKGDKVKVLSGKDRGQTGTVLATMPESEKVLLENLNVFKKRSRPRKQGEKGQTILVPRPLAASKVMLICSNCKEATRTGYRMDGAKKVRYCKNCEATI